MRRSRSNRTDDDKLVEVDEGMESLVVEVESAVVTYLVRIDDASRAALLRALEALDAHTAASEAYVRRAGSFATLTGVAALGRSSLDVIGRRSEFPAVSEVPLRVFQGQVALVRAAKEELRASSPATIRDLEAANQELAEARSRHVR